ncbi:hypothetical protein MKQ68_13435 [Chitinophaga horti]|uniref:Uncharacterized protein n=1 Tax=Chitinophaga horti TaxID=2920382 RepID=A0ABY6IV71_9BACT|nr:hypothetical protein [Chitinophaga horti]UYQ91096.1 hypothetical protein MKQ68_13435 [Chitinophaga horti]
MAIQTGIFPFTGKLGNVIGYNYRGKSCMRSMPAFVKQTTATRQAARDFGTASRCARILRHALENVADLTYDTTFGNRLNRAMGEVLRADRTHKRGRRTMCYGDLSRLNGLRVNANTFVHDDIEIVRHFDGAVSVSVTNPCSYLAPKATALQYRAIALVPDFNLGTCTAVVSGSVLFNPAAPQQGVELHLPVPADKQVIILLEVTCYNANGPMRMKYFNALDVMAVMPPMKPAPRTKKQPRVRDRGARNTAAVSLPVIVASRFPPG